MRLALAGINHRTAPVHIRERLAFRPEDVPAALRQLHQHGVHEALILSTCNRVEVTGAVDNAKAASSLIEWLLHGRDGLTTESIRPHLYQFEEAEAIRHLFRVAASLDSMIVGEPQILGQLKHAYAQARESGSIGRLLEPVLTRAFTVAKRIRTETEIGQSAVSVSYAAVELAREIFGTLNRKRVLIIGAGKMSESAGRHMLRNGSAELFITNRTQERADEMAALFSGSAIPYDSFPARLHEIDIVIASSSAPGYVLTREMVRRAIEARRNHPMFLIDIAVPRNIEPDVNKIEHAFLYDMDDLQQLAARNMQARLGVADQAEAIVTEEVLRLQARLRTRQVAPEIVGLQEQLEAVRREALERFRPKLGSLTAEQEQAVEALTRGIISKIAHGPISEMRRQAAEQAAEDGKGSDLVMSAVRRMFRLGQQ
ncbi:MAG TPA: glutamyl-tRNA reductase [Bryobacteraceae bacterium]|nr:glutamyl-tRNA reductase [Bryobacteraceae bacterium]